MSQSDSPLVRLRQWFQPYYQPQSPSSKRPANKRTQSSGSTPPSLGVAKQVKPKNDSPELRILDYPNPLNRAIEFRKKPSPNRVWCYHDNKRHHLFAHLLPQSGMQFRERDNQKRRKLEPMLYPTNVGTYDRTHVLPIGYHGSERDRRLLVGWDSAANRGIFEAFERKYKRIGKPVYWLTAIERTPTGATWLYRVYDADTLTVIDELTHTMTAQFAWKG